MTVDLHLLLDLELRVCIFLILQVDRRSCLLCEQPIPRDELAAPACDLISNSNILQFFGFVSDKTGRCVLSTSSVHFRICSLLAGIFDYVLLGLNLHNL